MESDDFVALGRLAREPGGGTWLGCRCASAVHMHLGAPRVPNGSAAARTTSIEILRQGPLRTLRRDLDPTVRAPLTFVVKLVLRTTDVP